MTIDSNTVGEMLSFDPLAQAEEVVGESYKTNKTAEAMGVALAMIHNQKKQQVLEHLGDSHYGTTLEQYQQIINALGFEKVLELPFEAKSLYGKGEVDKDTLFIYAHREKGILLKFDTFGQKKVNGGKFMYCWKHEYSDTDAWRVTSSGGYRHIDNPPREPQELWDEAWKDKSKLYWAGDHDCREAIAYNISRLDKYGVFLPKWPAGNGQFLWLLHYGDTHDKEYDYKAITAERLAMLPDWVQEMVNVTQN